MCEEQKKDARNVIERLSAFTSEQDLSECALNMLSDICTELEMILFVRDYDEDQDTSVGEKHIPISEVIRVLQEDCDHMDDAISHFKYKIK